LTIWHLDPAITWRSCRISYHPQMILSGRRLNDGMGDFIVQRLAKLLIAAERPVKGAGVGNGSEA
jgi:UDP-N-acetyl-D-galactosamine dehydrogenase